MRSWMNVVAGALGGALLAVVIVFAAARQGWLPGPAGGPVNIRGYLLGHPELLAEMTERLQAQQDASDKIKAASRHEEDRHGRLLRSPDRLHHRTGRRQEERGRILRL